MNSYKYTPRDFTPAEKIEIISVDILDQQRPLVEDLKGFARSLRLEFGWHYLLDLSWIISQLSHLVGRRIMDAGAGVGVMQWYLAQQGAEVISVDRLSRATLPLRYRSRFQVEGLRPEDLSPPARVLQQRFSQGEGLSKFTSPTREVIDILGQRTGSGQIQIYNQDLANLVDIPDASLDAIVSVSALEHNSQDGLAQVVVELMRTLKPGGVLLATLTAGRDQDRWHDASNAWCYSDATLKQIFDLPVKTPSNYDRYDEYFAALLNCAELRDNLAGFYFRSDQNGMPWGVWEPQYQPVGICKVKGLRE